MRSTLRFTPTFAVACGLAALLAVPGPGSAAPDAPQPAFGEDAEGRARANLYREGQEALDAGRWEEAADRFAAVAGSGGGSADAALYWHAYALHKASRDREALRALARLDAARHPASPWLDDARTLEAEIRQLSGRGEAPAPDGELALHDVTALLAADPERALAAVERILAGDPSPELARRALFVASQLGTPGARELVVRVARDGGSPQLAAGAIRMLGLADDEASSAALTEIFRSSTDETVRVQVLEAWMLGDEVEPLLTAAGEAESAAVAGRAVELLGMMGATDELRGMLAAEERPQVRRRYVEAFFLDDDVEALAAVAAAEEHGAEVRAAAIERLGMIGGDEVMARLRDLYAALPAGDAAARRAVLHAYFLSDEIDGLVAAARDEADPELRRAAVHQLGLIGGDAGRAALSELYESTDREVRRAVIEALFVDEAAAELAEIAEGEEDPELRRAARERLAFLDPDAAVDRLLGGSDPGE